jgi:NADH-quinone oxidoreductase subunit G
MACPGGCIGGAGQPVTRDPEAKSRRTKGLYHADKMLQLHTSQENHLVSECYEKHLGDVGGHEAHRLLHTVYQNRRRIADETLHVIDDPGVDRVQVSVCVGTSCFVRGAEALLRRLIEHIDAKGLHDRVHVEATFCFEKCDKGPTVRVNGRVLERATLEGVQTLLDEELARVPA